VLLYNDVLVFEQEQLLYDFLHNYIYVILLHGNGILILGISLTDYKLLSF